MRYYSLLVGILSIPNHPTNIMLHATVIRSDKGREEDNSFFCFFIVVSTQGPGLSLHGVRVKCKQYSCNDRRKTSI